MMIARNSRAHKGREVKGKYGRIFWAEENVEYGLMSCSFYDIPFSLTAFPLKKLY